MKRLAVTDLPLARLKLVGRLQLGDKRGFFARLYCAEELRSAGWTGPVAQINHTATVHKGTVRGLHFQRPPHAEMKLVTCIHGEVFDVAIDLRRGSPTFLNWHAERLSADNGRAMLIPEGFAHGFQAVSDNAEIIYCHSAAHAPGSEGALNPRDPRLAIDWPLPITDMSARDTDAPMLNDTFAGMTL